MKIPMKCIYSTQGPTHNLSYYELNERNIFYYFAYNDADADA